MWKADRELEQCLKGITVLAHIQNEKETSIDPYPFTTMQTELNFTRKPFQIKSHVDEHAANMDWFNFVEILFWVNVLVFGDNLL